MTGALLSSPAFVRNRDPILAVLRVHLGGGPVLEIASGSGEHVVYFAGAFPEVRFQPSDPAAGALASIDARVAVAGVANVLPAVALDARDADWPVRSVGAVVCINMLHIAPWEATVGLMRGAARVLVGGGVLYLYGP